MGNGSRVEIRSSKALGGFEEGKKIIEAYVHEYNHERLHSALNYLTPADYLKGEDNIKQRLERRKDALEKARKDRRQLTFVTSRNFSKAFLSPCNIGMTSYCQI